MPEVKCSVANCVFWGSGNNCTADAIMVDVDDNWNKNYEEEIGGEFVDTDHQYSARISADTCCHTFRPKRS
ncbi:DUF1540 domain-containing protein [Desmospora profundinema]|uniref:DUF1540 domain-containing protein n=1 Tax=Desmospora profundinema TaxID=1571184 RepID=A0ABU1IJP9_9BACL|nr:DUF1540 domain-containing protein [Desmospora profundinema]MDR6225001.1 hypothetical protein [Desmospora profundinema]